MAPTKLRAIRNTRISRTVKGSLTRVAPCLEPPPASNTCCDLNPQQTLGDTLYCDIDGGIWDGERVELVPSGLYWQGQTTPRSCGVVVTDDMTLTIRVQCSVQNSEWTITVITNRNSLSEGCAPDPDPMVIPWSSSQCNCDPDDPNCTPGKLDCVPILDDLEFTISECGGGCDSTFDLIIHCNGISCPTCEDAINAPIDLPVIEVTIPSTGISFQDCFEGGDNCCASIAGTYYPTRWISSPCSWRSVDFLNCPPPLASKALEIVVHTPRQLDSETWRVYIYVTFGGGACPTRGTYYADFNTVLPDCLIIYDDLTLTLESQSIESECLLPPTISTKIGGSRQRYSAQFQDLNVIIDASGGAFQDHSTFEQGLISLVLYSGDVAQTHSTFDQFLFVTTTADLSSVINQTYSTFDQDISVDSARTYTINQDHSTFEQEASSTTLPNIDSDAAQDHSTFEQIGSIVNESIIYGNPIWTTFEQEVTVGSDRNSSAEQHYIKYSQDANISVFDTMGDVAQDHSVFNQDVLAEGETILYDGLPIHRTFSQDVAAATSESLGDVSQTHSTYSQSINSTTERNSDITQDHSSFQQETLTEIAADGDISQNHSTIEQDIQSSVEVNITASQDHSIFDQDLVAVNIQISLNSDVAQDYSEFNQDVASETLLRVNGDSLYAGHYQDLSSVTVVSGDVDQTYNSLSQDLESTTVALPVRNGDVAQTYSSSSQDSTVKVHIGGDVAQTFETYSQDLSGIVCIQGDIAQLHSTYEQDLQAVAGCSVNQCAFSCDEFEGWVEIADDCFLVECQCGPVPPEEVCEEPWGRTISIDCVLI